MRFLVLALLVEPPRVCRSLRKRRGGSTLRKAIVFAATLVATAIVFAGCAAKIFPHPATVEEIVDSAELVVIRLRRGRDWWRPITILLNGEKLARLRSGNYARVRIHPGFYSIGTEEIGESFEFTARSNGKYFARIGPEKPQFNVTLGVGINFPSGDTSWSTGTERTLSWNVNLIDEEQAAWFMKTYTEIRGR